MVARNHKVRDMPRWKRRISDSNQGSKLLPLGPTELVEAQNFYAFEAVKTGAEVCDAFYVIVAIGEVKDQDEPHPDRPAKVRVADGRASGRNSRVEMTEQYANISYCWTNSLVQTGRVHAGEGF
jgi:hypothetical protein